MRRFVLLVAGLGALALTGAAAPVAVRALNGIAPGQWAVSRSASGHMPIRLCVPRLELLGQIAHGSEMCRRTILVDQPGRLVMDVNCARGDFARSEITVTTPRSLKIETQGFHRGEPFNKTFFARRVGECSPQRRQR